MPKKPLWYSSERGERRTDVESVDSQDAGEGAMHFIPVILDAGLLTCQTICPRIAKKQKMMAQIKLSVG